MKEKYLKAYLKMLKVFAETSEARRLKVAAMLIKNGNILSIGINGTPPGWYTNDCEDEEGNTQWYVRHAEQACLDRMLLSTETTKGSTMLITHAPCKLCSLRIKEAGIKEVIYLEEYRCSKGIDYLKENGIIVRQYNL